MHKLPKIVQARLQRSAPATAESHPDADLLTAFAERTLATRERDQVLEHLARCGNCRDVVALALPASEAVVPSIAASAARTGWLSLPVLRWGVVAAGVVLLTSVGILQYRQRNQEKTLVASSLTSREQSADSATQSPAPTPPAAASQPAPQAGMGKQTEMTKKSPAPVPAPSRAQGASTVNKPAAPHTIFRPEPIHRSTSAGAFHGNAAGSAFGSGSGYRSNAAPAAAAKQNPIPRAAQGAPAPSATTTVEVSGEAPLVEAETTAQNQIQSGPIQDAAEPADHVGKAKSAPAQASQAMAPAPLLRTEPVLKGPAAPRWTISANGALQRSLDGGATWLDVNIVVNESTNANFMRRTSTAMKAQVTVEASGAATEVETESRTEAASEPKLAAKSAAKPSPPVAKSALAQPAAPTIFRAVSVSSNAAEVWAGGSGGALYHTVDGGNRWARVLPSDAGIVLGGDVIRIQFSDPRNGIVTTSTAEIWTTLDAGQTWHKRQ
jgi:hypothetical protein